MPKKGNPPSVESLAADTKGGFDDASGLPVRLDRYSRAHHRALDMADYAREKGEVKTAINLAACGHHLLFRDYYQVGKVRLHAARFCHKHLLCPLCAIRRGAKSVQAYLARLHVIKEKSPQLRASLVTLTIKDGERLHERFKHLQNSFRRLQQARRSYLAGKGPHVELAKAEGAVGSYEFKRGRNSGLWHPHIHMVVLHRAEIDSRRLSEDWHKVTGDSFIVDVTPFRNQEDPVDGFLEVFKYAVKFSDLPLEDNWQGFKTLSGKRLVFSFGLFWGVDVPDELTDEALDDQPFIEILYRFAKGSGYQVEQVSKPLASVRAPARSASEDGRPDRCQRASEALPKIHSSCKNDLPYSAKPDLSAPPPLPPLIPSRENRKPQRSTALQGRAPNG